MDINKFSTPIDKTAARVTSQNKQKQTEHMRTVDAIEDLKKAMKSREDLIKSTKCKYKKIKYGKEKLALQEKIRPFNEKLKMLNMQKRENVNSLIIRECMSVIPKDEWDKIVSNAEIKFRKNEV